MEQRSILAVFAHPDDESFGTGGVLHMCADRGVYTALLCATRGEEGEISDPALATPETLGAVREEELRAACRILGIQDLRFLDYRDGALAQADPAEAIGRIVFQIRRLRPQVVVTFDANGGYGHLDHMAIHRFTTSAFRLAGDPGAYPDQIAEGLATHAPQKLYYTASPRSVMARVREALRDAGGDFAPGGNAATISIEQMGTPDAEVTTAVPLDDRAYQAKIDAWNVHRTQAQPDSFLDRLPPDLARALLGVERFVRAVPPAEPGEPPEDDLFASIRH